MLRDWDPVERNKNIVRGPSFALNELLLYTMTCSQCCCLYFYCFVQCLQVFLLGYNGSLNIQTTLFALNRFQTELATLHGMSRACIHQPFNHTPSMQKTLSLHTPAYNTSVEGRLYSTPTLNYTILL